MLFISNSNQHGGAIPIGPNREAKLCIRADMDIPRPEPHMQMFDNAKRVFKGVIFDVYQWEQDLFDGTTATYEALRRPDTAIVFPVMPDGKILLTKQQQAGSRPFIGGAGGRIEEGESALEGAKRELREETGYEADEWILWDAIQPVGKLDWAVYSFIAKKLRKAGDMDLDAGEKIELMPVTFDEFLDVATQKNFAEREIVPLVWQARAEPTKKEELRTMFQP